MTASSSPVAALLSSGIALNADVRMVLSNCVERFPGEEVSRLREEYTWSRDFFVAEKLGTGAELKAAAEKLRADRYAREGETEAERAAGFYLAAKDHVFECRLARGDFADEGWR